MEEAIALEAMRWRFESSQEYQNRDVIQRTEALVWDQGVAGSNPVIPTILISKSSLHWVVGRADMQPPFKRRDPGSTPGRPTFGLLAQLVEQPPLKRKCVGSIPIQSTK